MLAAKIYPRHGAVLEAYPALTIEEKGHVIPYDQEIRRRKRGVGRKRGDCSRELIITKEYAADLRISARITMLGRNNQKEDQRQGRTDASLPKGDAARERKVISRLDIETCLIACKLEDWAYGPVTRCSKPKA